jgi:hypothetical protein
MRKVVVFLFTIGLFFTSRARFSFDPKAGINIAKENYHNNFYSK